MVKSSVWNDKGNFKALNSETLDGLEPFLPSDGPHGYFQIKNDQMTYAK